MWTSDVPLWEIAFRTLVIYLVVLIGLRALGKREVGEMTPFDLVLLLLIANAVQNAMTGPDNSVTGGLVAAATLLVVNAIINRITFRSRRARHLIEGTPTLLIHSGSVVRKNMMKERISEDELQQALREHGIVDMKEVHIAVLEVDGSISVLKKEELPAGARQHHWIRFRKKKK